MSNFIGRTLGLKLLRSEGGPQEPNGYWKRAARPKCHVCGKRMRGKRHMEVNHPKAKAA